MSREEREAFLAEPHVAVVSVAADDGRAPLQTPMWYGYEPGGDITLITSGRSRKARLIREHGRVSLCVQETSQPYRYVSVEGVVTGIRETVTADERRAFADRYLGPQGARSYVKFTAEKTQEMILVTVRPEHWLTQDQS